MRTHLTCLVVAALSVVGPRTVRADEATALPVDPVELVAGRETPGDPSLAIDHGGYRYTFATAQNMRAFEASPAKYEIQHGGACARMGPLSSSCSTDHYAAYEGKVYVFASKQCRATFLKDPSRVLETPDPVPASTPASLQRGAELLALAITGLGGDAALDGLKTISYSTEHTETSDGKEYRVGASLRAALPDRFRLEESWDTSWWGHVLTPDDAFGTTSRGAIDPLVASQRDSLTRRVYRRTIPLLAQRKNAGFLAVALPSRAADPKNTERLAIAYRGATTTFTIDLESGRILRAERPSLGPDGFNTIATHEFEDFRPAGALTLPHRITTRYASATDAAPSIDALTIAVNEPLDAALFAR